MKLVSISRAASTRDRIALLSDTRISPKVADKFQIHWANSNLSHIRVEIGGEIVYLYDLHPPMGTAEVIERLLNKSEAELQLAEAVEKENSDIKKKMLEDDLSRASQALRLPLE